MNKYLGNVCRLAKEARKEIKNLKMIIFMSESNLLSFFIPTCCDTLLSQGDVADNIGHVCSHDFFVKIYCASVDPF